VFFLRPTGSPAPCTSTATFSTSAREGCVRISRASLKTACNQESAEEARAEAMRVMSKWRPLLPEACSVLEEGQKDTLTFCLPRSHQRHIRSDGPWSGSSVRQAGALAPPASFPIFLLPHARLCQAQVDGGEAPGKEALHGHRSFTRGTRKEIAGDEAGWIMSRMGSHGRLWIYALLVALTGAERGPATRKRTKRFL